MIDHDKPRGLKNLGHTCFLNTVSQILVNLPGLRDVFSNRSKNHYLPRLELLRAANDVNRESCKSKLISSLTAALSTGYRSRVRSSSAFLEKLLSDASTGSSSEVNEAFDQSMTEHLLHLRETLDDSRGDGYSPLSYYMAFLGLTNAEPFTQNDVSEFFLFLADKLHSEFVFSITKKPSHKISYSSDDQSYISHLFRGTVISNTRCKSCGEFKNTESPFVDLSLDIPTTKVPLIQRSQSKRRYEAVAFSVEDCFAEFIETKSAGGGSRCSHCGDIDTLELSSCLGDLPQIMVINLSRAVFDSGRGAMKNRTFVDVPEHLDLSIFQLPDRQQTSKYDLCGVIIHHGRGSDSGHYTCYSRRVTSRAGGDQWYHYNDTDVVKISSIDGSLKDLPQSLSQPCLLFYAKSDLERVPSYSHFNTHNHDNHDTIDHDNEGTTRISKRLRKSI